MTESLSFDLRIVLLILSLAGFAASIWNLREAQRDLIASRYSKDIAVRYAAHGLRNTQLAFVVIAGFSLLAWICTIIRFLINPIELETSTTYGSMLTTVFLIVPQIALTLRSVQGNIQRISFTKSYSADFSRRSK